MHSLLMIMQHKKIIHIKPMSKQRIKKSTSKKTNIKRMARRKKMTLMK